MGRLVATTVFHNVVGDKVEHGVFSWGVVFWLDGGERGKGRVGEGVGYVEVRDVGVGRMARKALRSHTDLQVYQAAFDAAMRIFELSKQFPVEERYALTDQIRRSSRSVCANLAEAWRKRRYQAAFIAKLSDAEAEAAETQTWLEFAVRCQYLDSAIARDLYQHYNQVLGQIIQMLTHPEHWLLTPTPK